MIIYVGDSSNIRRRIQRNHCSGNIEASALRRHIAQHKGYNLKRTKRSSGSTRIRIDSPDPKACEAEISKYLRSGHWKYVGCSSKEEARDFQWYAIEQTAPLLNIERKKWNTNEEPRYRALLEELRSIKLLPYEEISDIPNEPGVYIFYHQDRP